METMAGFGVLVAIFLVVLAILWLLVPFLIMGTNSRIDKLAKLIREQQEIQDMRTKREILDLDTHIRCPACREPVRKEATKCPHCASSLVPAP
jgi:predicted PurR-regulated permease PerM